MEVCGWLRQQILVIREEKRWDGIMEGLQGHEVVK